MLEIFCKDRRQPRPGSSVEGELKRPENNRPPQKYRRKPDRELRAAVSEKKGAGILPCPEASLKRFQQICSTCGRGRVSLNAGRPTYPKSYREKSGRTRYSEKKPILSRHAREKPYSPKLNRLTSGKNYRRKQGTRFEDQLVKKTKETRRRANTGDSNKRA